MIKKIAYTKCMHQCLPAIWLSVFVLLLVPSTQRVQAQEWLSTKAENHQLATAQLDETALNTLQYSENTAFVFYNPQSLNALTSALAADRAPSFANQTIAALVSSANKALQLPTMSVTHKSELTVSQNKHDYVSLSRYWWPNPNTENGLPWIRKDGLTNPMTQSETVDRPRLGRFTNAVDTLSLAYFFSHDERYAQHAARLIKAWFLHKDTYMTPHLEYGQRVPGNNKGRRAGILDGRLIPEHILDAVNLIRPSKYWQQKDDAALNKWLNTYLDWLTSSKLGKHAATSKNNHGSWYHFQVISLAHYLGKTATVIKYAGSLKQLINEQIDAEGLQQYELDRSRTYFYSTFNLNALSRSAIVLQSYNINLWGDLANENANTPAKETGSMRKALAYMIQYMPANTKWPFPHKQQNAIWLLPLILRASQATPNVSLPHSDYKALIQQATLDILQNETSYDAQLFLRELLLSNHMLKQAQK